MAPMLSALAAAAIGLLLSPFIRGAVFAHSVPGDKPPRRACPHCGQTASKRIAHLPPVLLASGRCRYCRTRLGPAVGSVEITATIALGLLAWRIPWPLPFLAFGWVAVIGVALSYIDLAVHRLPNHLIGTALSGGLALLVLAAVLRTDFRRLMIAVLCALTVSAFYLLLSLLPRGYGLGDVKLGLIVGLTSGWWGWTGPTVATLAAALLAGLTAGILVVRRSGHSHIAHGPFMLAGALLAVLVAA